MKRKRMVAAGLFVVFLGAMIITFIMIGNEKIELAIGKEKIPEEEFLLAMSSEKYDVTQYFYKQYGAEVTKDFWQKEYEGEAPYYMLADNSIESLKKIHAVYEIAKDKGYLEKVGYGELLKRFEGENKVRAEKINKGEPVYGLSKFSLDLFLEYEMDGLQKLYVNDLTNEGMSISDKEAMNYYVENKDKLFVKPDDMELEFIKIYYASLGLEESAVDSLEKDLKKVYKGLNDEVTLGSIVENQENLKPYYQHVNVLSAEVSSRAREMGDVFELATDLESGESTQVINQNGSLYLIRLINRVSYGYVPFEQVKDNVLKALREQNYDQVVAKKAQQIKVNGDLNKVYKFTKKQLIK